MLLCITFVAVALLCVIPHPHDCFSERFLVKLLATYFKVRTAFPYITTVQEVNIGTVILSSLKAFKVLLVFLLMCFIAKENIFFFWLGL